MANVDLGTFTFDAQAVDEQLSKLRTQMALLRDERKKYGDQEKDFNKIIDATIKKQEELVATGKAESDEMKVTNKFLKDLQAERQKVFNKNKELSAQQSKLNKEYREASSLINSLTDAEGNRVTSTEAINVALNKEIKSIADARASNKELLALRNQLDIADENNADSLAELNAALDRNNAFIKENVSAYEQQKIGIGDYQTAIENALGGTKLFGVGLNDVKSQLQNFAPILNTIKGELTSIKTSFQTATQSTQGFSTAQKAMAVTTAATSGALKLLRVALIATGIGAIVVVLGSLIAFLASTQKGIDLVTSVTRPLTAVFGTLVGILQEVGEFLFEAFSNPQKTIKEVYDFVKNNVIAQFKALAKILEGIFTMDFGLLKEGFSDLADNATKNINLIAGAAGKIGDRLAEAYARGQEVDRLMKQLSKSEADFITNQAQLKENLKQQNLIAEDQTKTLSEREAAAKRSIEIAREVNNLQRERLEIERNILELNAQNNDTSDKEKAEIAQKIADINAANAQLLEIETTQQNKLNAIRKEAAAKAIAERQRILDDASQKAKLELDLFIQGEEGKAQSLQQSLDLAKKIKDERLAIAQAEFETTKKTENDKLQLQIAQQEIQKEFLESTQQATIDYANAELELWKQTNQSKIEQGKELTQALVDEEAIRLANIRDKDTAQLELELGTNQATIDRKKAMNEQLSLIDLEYLTKKSQIDAEYQTQILANEEALKAEFKQKELDALEVQNELDIAAAADKFEVDRINEQIRYDAEIAKLKERREKGLITDAQYDALKLAQDEQTAEAQKAIDQAVLENKLQLTANTFGALATIAGKESKAGKAFAVAQATIDTISSAISSYNSLSGIPIVGPALGAVAAAAALASGYANVKKIVATKTPQAPKAERGMRVPKLGTLLKGRSHKQGGIPIEAEGGEAIINKRSTSMFPGLLSAINVAGGGIPLAARGAVVGNVASRNANIQSRLLNDVNNNAMAESVATAVREGAMEGSMVGSQQGSQSGLIGLSENREVQRNSAF